MSIVYWQSREKIGSHRSLIQEPELRLQSINDLAGKEDTTASLDPTFSTRIAQEGPNESHKAFPNSLTLLHPH